MKFNVIFLFIFAVKEVTSLQLLNHIRERIRLFHIEEMCIIESGANAGDITQIVLRMQPIRIEGQCLISCILRKIGLQDEDFRSRLESVGSNVLYRLQEENQEMYERIMQVIGKCIVEVHLKELKDVCELAFEIVSCGVRQGVTGTIENLFSSLLRDRHNSLLSV